MLPTTPAIATPVANTTSNPTLRQQADPENLSDRFKKLNQHNIKYVILMGHTGLPFQFSEPIVMLYETAMYSGGKNAVNQPAQDGLTGYRGRDKSIVTILDLKPLGNPDDLTYEICAGKKTQQITLIPKGIGFLPGLFESRLITSRMPYNQDVAIPSTDVHALALIYHKIYRENWLQDQPVFRELMCKYIERLVGPEIICEMPLYQRKR